VEDRFSAVSGVFLDGEVIEDKARPGQQAHLDGGQTHRAAQRSGDQLSDAAFIAAHAQERGHYQDGQENSQRRQGEPKPLCFCCRGCASSLMAFSVGSGQWSVVSVHCYFHPMEGPAPAGFGKEV